MVKYYTGVGSRKVPQEYITVLGDYAFELARLGYIARTGDAVGCDSVFRESSCEAIVYSPRDIIDNDEHWSYAEVKKHMPTDRTGFDTWKPFVRALLARNMMQVLGPKGDQPSEFLLCWAPSGYYLDSSSGGTGYAIRAALSHKIPVYNLFIPTDRIEFELFFELLIEAENK